MPRICVAGIAVLLASLHVQPSAQVTVSVDRGERYQTIEGFGAVVHISPWTVYDGPFPVKVNMDSVSLYDSLVGELGVSMMRIYSDGKLEQTPGVIDNPQALSEAYYNVRRLSEVTERQAEPLRFISTSWSPPAWMKVNGEIFCDFAEHSNCMTTECRLKPAMATAKG